MYPGDSRSHLYRRGLERSFCAPAADAMTAKEAGPPGKLAWSPPMRVSQRPEINEAASEVVRHASSIHKVGFRTAQSGVSGPSSSAPGGRSGIPFEPEAGKMKSGLVGVGVVRCARFRKAARSPSLPTAI